MQALQELLANRVLISGLVGWGAAQVLKTIIYALMHRTLDLTRIFGDDGMPSGHSATVCAVATSAGILYGLGSFPFAISVIVAIKACRWASQVAKHPSLYWLAIESPTAGTFVRSDTRTISVKKLRWPSSRPAVFIACGVERRCHSAWVTTGSVTAC